MKLIDLNSHSLGDLVAALPYVQLWSEQHETPVTVKTNLIFQGLFKQSYPDIRFTDTLEGWQEADIVRIWYKFDRAIQAGYAEQLGFENPPYIRPKIDRIIKDRPMQQPYVTFGVHSTAQLKHWNSTDGRAGQTPATNWNELCKMIKSTGRMPVCLSKHELFGKGPEWNGLPAEAHKVFADLEEVINWMWHSEFFIGPSSGLAWVAHALGKPVVMIANFTKDWNEFDINLKDYKRITDESVCHGCWHTEKFDGNNWYWCPKHADTDREFECHKAITPERVFETIEEWLI